MFTGAITRKPGRSVAFGITSAPELGQPDFDRAVRQHENYVRALRCCGLTVEVLAALEEYPDACFVEDAAVITEKCIVIASPGAPSRQGETVPMAETLKKCFPGRAVETIGTAGPDSTLDGGDVLRIRDHFYIGISDRTSETGARRLQDILRRHGFDATLVPVGHGLHLKSGLTYLHAGNLVISEAFADREEFRIFRKIVVHEPEAYAANCLWINGNVVVPAGFERTSQEIAALGYKVLEIDMSEFQKIDGGLTCLSLRY